MRNESYCAATAPAWCAGLCLLLLGCGSADFTLRVRNPVGSRYGGAHVRLMAKQSGPCGWSQYFNGETNASGQVRIRTRGCGEERLVVGLPGAQTHEQVLNTCEAKGFEIALRAAPAPLRPADDCARAAQRFIDAWLKRDSHALRDLLASPDDAERYADSVSETPWAIDFTNSRVERDSCIVDTRFALDNGCRMPWEVSLVRIADGWKVRGVRQVELEVAPR